MAAAAADVVIAGAGLAGLWTARHLSRLSGSRSLRIAIVEPEGPVAWTSSLSTECFRTFWPQQAQTVLVARGVQLMEEFHEELSRPGPRAPFHLERRGYLYLSRRAAECVFPDLAHRDDVRRHAGPLRASQVGGLAALARGVDVFEDRAALQSAFPWVGPSIRTGIWARNAGWVQAQTLGMCLLESLRGASAGGGSVLSVIRGAVDRVSIRSGRVQSVRVSSGVTIDTPVFINAAGPNAISVHHTLHDHHHHRPAHRHLASGDLPLYNELHAKTLFFDPLGAIPRSAPMTILMDRARIHLDNDHTSSIQTDDDDDDNDEHGANGLSSANDEWASVVGPHRAKLLTQPAPSGAHFRPYGGDGSTAVMALWEPWHAGVIDVPRTPPRDPVAAGLVDTDMYPQVVIAALRSAAPGLGQYLAGTPVEGHRRSADGGYYTRAPDNVPLAGRGPMPVDAPSSSSASSSASSEADVTHSLHRGVLPPQTTSAWAGSPEGYVLCCGLSGYGVMASPGAAEVAARVALGDSFETDDQLSGGADIDSALQPPRHEPQSTTMYDLGKYRGFLDPLRYSDPSWVASVYPRLMERGSGQL